MGTTATIAAAQSLAQSRAKVVQGLAHAASATITTNPIAAAGLAMAAAAVAEAMPPAAAEVAPTVKPSTIAGEALAVAKAVAETAEGSETAAALIEAAAAVEMAQNRSKGDLELVDA